MVRNEGFQTYNLKDLLNANFACVIENPKRGGGGSVTH
jgi:hypothetical protein